MESFTAIFVLAVICVIYFLPTIVAHNSNHKQKEAIFALNLLGGWTLIGWIAAFVWALTK